MKEVLIQAINFFPFYPFPFLIGLLIITLACIHHRKRGKLYLPGLFLFGLYVLMVIDQVFFPIPLAANWPANLTWKDTYQSLTGINLIPFKYGTKFLYEISPKIIFWEIARNVLLTAPFGFGICFLSKLRGKRVIWLALSVGLVMEATQLLIRLMTGYFYHSVDINDVLLNMLGVLVGSGLYRVAYWIVHSVRVDALKTSG